jgi:hypothetical protein
MEKNKIETFKESITGMMAMVEATKVTTPEELDAISDKIKNVRGILKIIKAQKEKFVAPAKQIIEEARTKYDPYIKDCDNAETVLKSKATAYMVAQEVIRKEEEDKIAKKLEDGKIKTETAVKRIEKLPDAPKNVQTENSGLQLRKRKVAVIEDPNLIPDEYWIIDEVRVRKDAMDREKNGLPQIPGVIIKEEVNVAAL